MSEVPLYSFLLPRDFVHPISSPPLTAAFAEHNDSAQHEVSPRGLDYSRPVPQVARGSVRTPVISNPRETAQRFCEPTLLSCRAPPHALGVSHAQVDRGPGKNTFWGYNPV